MGEVFIEMVRYRDMGKGTFQWSTINSKLIHLIVKAIVN
jgi:hypothetical protein